jgi:hypothetical protein
MSRVHWNQLHHDARVCVVTLQPLPAVSRIGALDLIHVDENGYRLVLSFRIATERHDPVVPAVLEESQTLLHAADSLLETILPPSRYGDPDDPLGSALFWPLNPSQLLEYPMVSSWIRLAAALTATEFTEDNRAVQMGSPPLHSWKDNDHFRTRDTATLKQPIFIRSSGLSC